MTEPNTPPNVATCTTLGAFRGVGGVPIHTISCTISGDGGKGDVVLVHGLAEHSGRYGHVFDSLLGAGWDVHALDHRGHGRSGIQPGYIDRFEHLVSDVEHLVGDVRQTHSHDRPLVLFGHSMGALAAVQVGIRRRVELDGIIATAIPLVPTVEAPAWMMTMSQIVTKVAPRLPTVELDASGVSRDPDVVMRYEHDPFVYRGRLPARTAAEVLEAADWAIERLPRLAQPLLVMHGGADTMVSVEGSKLLAEKTKSHDVTLEIWDECYHEILNEPEQDEVLAKIVEWLDDRFAGWA